MLRKSRIDAPGAFHHIIGRGINRQEIFSDKMDYGNFLDRLGDILGETKISCHSWALMPNHFNMLLKTGDAPISTVMRRLLTGYAITYNRRHCRCGHLRGWSKSWVWVPKRSWSLESTEKELGPAAFSVTGNRSAGNQPDSAISDIKSNSAGYQPSRQQGKGTGKVSIIFFPEEMIRGISFTKIMTETGHLRGYMVRTSIRGILLPIFYEKRVCW